MNKLITKNNNLFNLVEDFFNDDFFGKMPTQGNTNGSYAIERINDNEYVIKVNVAGFKKDEIEITQSNGYINIKGEQLSKEESNNNNNYIHNNFASSFSNSFKLSDDIEHIDASINDGILNIYIKEKVNLAKNIKKIDIR